MEAAGPDSISPTDAAPPSSKKKSRETHLRIKTSDDNFIIPTLNQAPNTGIGAAQRSLSEGQRKFEQDGHHTRKTSVALRALAIEEQRKCGEDAHTSAITVIRSSSRTGEQEGVEQENHHAPVVAPQLSPPQEEQRKIERADTYPADASQACVNGASNRDDSRSPAAAAVGHSAAEEQPKTDEHILQFIINASSKSPGMAGGAISSSPSSSEACSSPQGGTPGRGKSIDDIWREIQVQAARRENSLGSASNGSSANLGSASVHCSTEMAESTLRRKPTIRKSTDNSSGLRVSAASPRVSVDTRAFTNSTQGEDSPKIERRPTIRYNNARRSPTSTAALQAKATTFGQEPSIRPDAADTEAASFTCDSTTASTNSTSTTQIEESSRIERTSSAEASLTLTQVGETGLGRRPTIRKVPERLNEFGATEPSLEANGSRKSHSNQAEHTPISRRPTIRQIPRHLSGSSPSISTVARAESEGSSERGRAISNVKCEIQGCVCTQWQSYDAAVGAQVDQMNLGAIKSNPLDQAGEQGYLRESQEIAPRECRISTTFTAAEGKSTVV